MIWAFSRSRKPMPHDRELVAITGLRPTHALCTLVEHIITCEPLAQEAMRRLLPERRCAHLPLLGTVTAGFPSPAEEELLDTMTLDEFLITNREATYLLKVTGESMIEAGILPGDWLLVERGAAAPYSWKRGIRPLSPSTRPRSYRSPRWCGW